MSGRFRSIHSVCFLFPKFITSRQNYDFRQPRTQSLVVGLDLCLLLKSAEICVKKEDGIQSER